MPTLSWRHHTLIQALLSRGPLKEDDFRSIFSQVSGKSSVTPQQQEQLFHEFLRKINAELNYVQFELRACRNQYDGKVYYGVVNNVLDDQSKLGTRYSVPQIAYYKAIVEAIILDAEAKGNMLTTDALSIRLDTQFQGGTDSQSQGTLTQVPPALRNFSLSQKDKTLEQLVKDGWLSSTPDGKVGLGVRSFLDLRSWFRTNEVPSCEVCNEAAVKAQLCQNEACNVRLHEYCAKKKFSLKRAEKDCSGCGTRWPGVIVKAEAVKEEDDPDIPSQNTQRTEPSSRKRRRAYREVGTGSAGNDSCQTSASQSDSRRVTRRSARLNAT